MSRLCVATAASPVSPRRRGPVSFFGVNVMGQTTLDFRLGGTDEGSVFRITR